MRRHLSALCDRRDGVPIASPSTIPETYRESAEQVRAHLVHLRGGAPFLSPAEAVCLLGWLDARVSARVILAAIDRAFVSRHRRGVPRRPLSLTAARVHLGKPPLLPPALAPGGDHPFSPARAALIALPDPFAHALADALTGIAPEHPERIVPAAVTTCSAHHELAWDALPAAEREQRIAAEHAGLGDLLHLLGEEEARTIAEEIAREAFRARWPRLDTATFDALAAGCT